VIFLGFIK